MCVLSGVSSGYQTQRKSGDTGGRDKVYFRCELSCESSGYPAERRTLYTWSRSTGSHHCELSCDSSGDQVESLVTLGTGIRFLSRVDSNVSP